MEHFLSLISSQRIPETTPASRLMGYSPRPLPLRTSKWNVSLRWVFALYNLFFFFKHLVSLQALCKSIFTLCDQFISLHLRPCTRGPNVPGNVLACGHGGAHYLPRPGWPPCAVCQLDQRWERFESWQRKLQLATQFALQRELSQPAHMPHVDHFFFSPVQFPGWIVNSEGSVFIATANDNAVGMYTCTAYNSYGTMGKSEPTKVILQVRRLFFFWCIENCFLVVNTRAEVKRLSFSCRTPQH